MKKFVYELINLMGTIEYVGETKRPKERFIEHTKKLQGKFYNRLDLTMNIVAEFDNKKDAYNKQCELQKQYGLLTDEEVRNKNFENRHNGYKHSEETKLKMKLAKLGKPSNRLGTGKLK